MIDISPFVERFKTKPFEHQVKGVQALVNNPFFALFDEMGVGKTKQAIDAQCILYELGQTNLAIVVTPASVRRSWIDPYFGEISKHCWVADFVIYEYHSHGLVKIFETSPKKPRLVWIVTNYEYVRQAVALRKIEEYAWKHKTTLILDESSFIKNPSSQRTKACFKVRAQCKRVYLLNGTPMSNSVLDLFPQSKIMSAGILGIRTKTEFKAKYCKMGGPDNRFILGAQNVEDLQRRMKPFVLRRKKEDCLDLPEKIFTQIPVPMSEKAWKLYCEMREEACVSFGDSDISLAPQMIVRLTRLSQITSGIMAGLVEMDEFGQTHGDPRHEIIWKDKAEFVRRFILEQLEVNPKFRLIVWGRFRPEREMLRELLGNDIPVFQIFGGVKEADRNKAIEEFSIDKDRPAVLLAQQQSGGFGLNLVSAHNNIYMSNTRSLMDRLQSEDRTHRQGQRFDVNYWDLIATGPRGQRTIDHIIYNGLREKQNIAEWTTGYWREQLDLQQDLYVV